MGTNERNAKVGQKGPGGRHFCRQRSSNNTAMDRAILSKFGFERDLSIAERVLWHSFRTAFPTITLTLRIWH